MSKYEKPIVTATLIAFAIVGGALFGLICLGLMAAGL